VTLRTRLLLSLGVLLAAALVVSGGLVVGLTRASLVQQLDDDIQRVDESDLFAPPPQRGNDPTGRRFAFMLFDRAGNVVQALPSGRLRDPDPLPDVRLGAQPNVPIGSIVEQRSADGSVAYRLIAARTPQGAGVVLAAPMTDIEQSMLVLIRYLAVVGLVALGAMLAIAWLIIRRDLRPLEQITAAAEGISAGDLSRRVGVPDDGSEVGRLGQAFDRMLDQIQGAFDSQHAALVAKERSESQLRQFVADASHELRTPLTSVRGYAELYRAGGLEDAAALDQAMSRIGTESRRMATLVEDLLLLARLDQGRPLRQEPVVLSTLVNDAVADVRAVEPERVIRATVEDDVVVRGDEDRLRQVIGNLFANVRVHTPVSATVDVSLSSADGVARLSVADHGPGVDPQHVDQIFNRFYRADTGRSRDRGGAGLGLAIASSVAAAHGGTISHSPTPGGGATFTLTLPRPS
jgi:two-component system, OmpR family, sensor kinase